MKDSDLGGYVTLQFLLFHITIQHFELTLLGLASIDFLDWYIVSFSYIFLSHQTNDKRKYPNERLKHQGNTPRITHYNALLLPHLLTPTHLYLYRPANTIPKTPIPMTTEPSAKLFAPAPVLGVTVGVAGGV